MKIRSNRKSALSNNDSNVLIRNEKYLSNKHFLILLEIIDKSLENVIEKFSIIEIESNKMDRYFPSEDNIGKEFIPEKEQKYSNGMKFLQDKYGNRMQSKYYWLFVQKMGCKLFVNKIDRCNFMVLKKNEKIMGSIMPIKPLENI